MSKIDENIVSMKFNNGQFEKGIKSTLDALSSLRKGLNLEGAQKSLSEVGASVKNLDVSSLGSSVDGISAKFVAMAAVGITALTNLANRAVDAGVNIVKALTIDPVADGYGDYERKLTSVQTVMNATGKSLKTVSKRFDQLDEYADLTIYNLDDMTSALAKFVNAGVDLKLSIPAIKGIGNATAYAGQGAGEAQLAYRNFSDAISKGYMGGGDWLSLKNSNVITKEFKDVMIETGIEMGTLRKTAKGTFDTLGKGADKSAVSSAELFNVLGETQWADTNVLMGTLSKFADTTTKLGKKAQGSAQDVKSFSMMFETLSASVGTGWTDTFELLFGNVEEAKKVFTPLTGVFSSMIDGITALRNDPLEAWKDAGGREAVINGLKNAFEALGNVFGPIKDAFAQVFPPSSGQLIITLSKGFEKLTSALKIGGVASNAIKGVFVGIFTILKFGIEIVKGVIRYFLDFASILGQSVQALAPIGVAIGELLGKIQNWVGASDGVRKFFDLIIAGRREAMDPLIDFVGRLATAIATLIRGDFQGFKEQFLASFEAFTPLVDKAKIALDGLKTGVGVLGTTFENVKNLALSFFADSSAEAQKLYTGALTGLLGYVDRLKQAFEDLKSRMSIKADTVGADVAAGMGASLSSVETVGERVQTLWGKLAEGFGKVKTALAPVINGIIDVFNNVKTKVADFLKSLTFEDAVAMLNTGILIGLYMAIKGFVDKLSGLTVDISKITESISGTFDKLTGTLSAMQTSLKAGTILKIAIAVGILVAAVVALSLIDAAALGKALGAMTVLFGGLMTSMQVFSKISAAGVKGLGEAGVALVLLAVAIRILASAVEKLAQLSWEELAKGLVGVGGLLAALGLFLKFTQTSEEAFLKTGGLIALAIAVNLLAFAVGKLGSMDLATLGKGLLAIALVMSMLSGFAEVVSGSKGVFQAAAGMLILSVSMLALTFAIKAMAAIPFGTLIKGVAAMSIALTGIGLAMRAMPAAKMAASATALIVISGAILILAHALTIVGAMPIEDILQAVIAIEYTLAALVVATNLLGNGGGLKGAAAMLMIATALGALVPMLLLLGSTDLQTLAIGLGALAAIFVVFGVAGLVLAPIVPILIGLGAAMMLISGAMLLAGVGMLSFSAGFATLAAVGTAGTAVIVSAMLGLGAIIPTLMTQVGMGIKALAKVISESGPVFIKAMTTLIISLAVAVRKSVPEIMETVFTLIEKMLEIVVEAVPMFVEAGLKLLVGLLNGIANQIGDVIEAGVNIIVAFLDGIGKAIPRIIQAGIDLVLDFIDGLTSAITNNQERVNTSMRNLATAMIDAMTGAIANVGSIGLDIVLGIARGIRDNMARAWDAARDMARGALDAARDFLGIASPSKEFKAIGKFAVQGFAKGLSGSRDQVKEAISLMRGALKDTMKGAKDDVAKYEEQLEKLNKAKKKDNEAIKKATKNLEQSRKEYKATKNTLEDFDKVRAKQEKRMLNVAKAHDKQIEKVEAEKEALEALKQAKQEYAAELSSQYSQLPDFLNNETLDASVDKAQKAYDEVAQRSQNAAAALEAANVKMADSAKTIREQFDDLPGIDKNTTVESYIAKLKKDDAALRKFAEDLQTLRTYGLDDETYQQLLAQGPEAQKFIDRLVKAGPEAIAEIDKLNDQLAATAKDFGNTASTVLYGDAAKAAKIEADKFAAELAASGATITGAQADLVGAYLTELRSDNAANTKFTQDLKILRDTFKLNDKVYQELLSKGTTVQPFVTALLASGKSGVDQINAETKNLVGSATTLGNQAAAAMYDAGIQSSAGLLKGLQDREKDLQAMMDRLASTMVGTLKKGLGIKSPSREFAKLGAYSVDGIVKGMRQSTPSLVKASSGLGEEALSSMRSAISQASAVLATEVDMSPTIRPVLDLTAIEKGAGLLNGMLPGATMKVDASYMRAARISAYETATEARVTPADSSPVANQVTYIQNNTSPKSLSTTEIYRQTRNQLSRVKGGLPY